MAAEARKVNWFAIWVSVAVVVVLVVVAVLVVAAQPVVDDPGEAPQAANIDFETGAILVGDGENTLDTYIDFMCPVCGQFEQLYGPTIQSLVDDGTITLGIHPIAILDRPSQGTEFSTRAANAMYCVAVADGEAAVPFMQAMFANQPAEGTPGLTDEQILEIAAGAGVEGIDDCVNDGRYSKYVTEMTEKTPVQPGAGGIGTPTIVVNGEVIANSTLPEPADLASLFAVAPAAPAARSAHPFWPRHRIRDETSPDRRGVSSRLRCLALLGNERGFDAASSPADAARGAADARNAHRSSSLHERAHGRWRAAMSHRPKASHWRRRRSSRRFSSMTRLTVSRRVSARYLSYPSDSAIARTLFQL